MQFRTYRWAVAGGLIAGAVAGLFALRGTHPVEPSSKRSDIGQQSPPTAVADPNGAPAPAQRAAKKPAVAPAPAANPTSAAQEPETVVRARWGSKPGELGKKQPNEGAPEAPMGFEVDERGRAFVLDQVNSRVEVFEQGHEPRSIPLPADTFQDLALAKNDGLVLLDRLSTGSIAYLDSNGKLTHEIVLAGQGVGEGGDVTALASRSDGTWVEVKHANLVRVADADGNPLSDRDIAQGRFASDGVSVLRASKSGSRAAYVSSKSPDQPVTALARVSFDMDLWQIIGLETDRNGRIFLGVYLIEESQTPPFEAVRSRELVVVLGADGAELRRVEFPASTGPEESFRRIRVGADGALYHMGFDEDGATLRKVAL